MTILHSHLFSKPWKTINMTPILFLNIGGRCHLRHSGLADHSQKLHMTSRASRKRQCESRRRTPSNHYSSKNIRIKSERGTSSGRCKTPSHLYTSPNERRSKIAEASIDGMQHNGCKASSLTSSSQTDKMRISTWDVEETLRKVTNIHKSFVMDVQLEKPRETLWSDIEEWQRNVCHLKR